MRKNAYLKSVRHIIFTLLAVAAFGLLAAGSVSCGGASKRGETVSEQNNQPSADTLALIKGLRLFEEGEYELARNELQKSSLSNNTYIRAESFLYLNALEMELGNYDEARPWLEKYHAETVRLLRNAADASKRMAEQAKSLHKWQNTLVAGIICIGILVVGTVIFFVGRSRRATAIKKDSPPAVSRPPDTSEWKSWLVDAEIFKQRAIWGEILLLAGQRPGREAKVLTSARQEVLDRELAEVFSDFAARLRGDCPSLTAGDVKLCCLALLPLSPFARALCFGSTETNIIKQRKHTVKKKLTSNPGDDDYGRALFEFIFEARR